jgi:uncharacterized protein (DUF1778 family)
MKKKPKSDSRSARLEIRITPTELADIKRAAKASGDSTSTWSRRALKIQAMRELK